MEVIGFFLRKNLMRLFKIGFLNNSNKIRTCSQVGYDLLGSHYFNFVENLDPNTFIVETIKECSLEEIKTFLDALTKTYSENPPLFKVICGYKEVPPDYFS